MNNTKRPTGSLLGRRSFLAGTSGVLLLGLAACSSDDSTGSSSSAGSASSSGSPDMSGGPGGAMGGGGTGAVSDDAQALIDEVADAFTQESFTDPENGNELPYNLFLPDGYDESQTYPVVFYIADSSLVGQDVTAPLNQYGALIWASSTEQDKHASIVVVPEFPSVTIDDHDSYTTTSYVDTMKRLVAQVQEDYSVDSSQVYATGQSMGCMTFLYLTGQDPDLFTAELFVSGQWQTSDLTGLETSTFTYIAAGGDENASGGQADVESMLDDAGISYATTTLDATDSQDDQDAAIESMYDEGLAINIATFDAGTVISAAEADGGDTSSEHMASFEAAYKIEALRDWLFSQTS
ncbi:alpha/beta hydrolase-fold protein [Nocardioides sp. GY 10127]|uniref:carboxylesterase family protein n=1 Tax=Nocardioides sp. GY 10127 TaxID=2569762 RepID=UPI0010A8C332|nr:alpha/beta hydrolase-fold protein [Nocardioides sp. GY 10127]TIC86611.1 esterase [Nocardioides sp. GY 10127]